MRRRAYAKGGHLLNLRAQWPEKRPLPGTAGKGTNWGEGSKNLKKTKETVTIETGAGKGEKSQGLRKKITSWETGVHRSGEGPAQGPPVKKLLWGGG